MVMVASTSRCNHLTGAPGPPRPPTPPPAQTPARLGSPGRWAASIRSSTSRHIVVVDAAGTEDMFAITAPLPDTVDAVRAVGHRGGQIGEHRTRLVDPRSPIGIRQRRP